jgi:hypothetical protein
MWKLGIKLSGQYYNNINLDINFISDVGNWKDKKKNPLV